MEENAICVFTSQTGYNKNITKVVRDRQESIAGAAFTRLIDVKGSKQMLAVAFHIPRHAG
eukprot:6725391-Ditylum_brightwellii.AAC.1